MAKLLNLNVNFISIVDDGANRKPIVYKNDLGDQARFDLPIRIAKADVEKGIIYGVVYEPDTTDTQGDWADAPTIERAAHDFLIKGKVRMVDTMHDYTPIDGGVVESFIKNGEANNYPDAKDGAWLVAIKPDDMTKMKVKSGEYRGISLSGTALPDNEKRKSSDAPTARIIKNSSSARIIKSARIIHALSHV
ncbi:MAG TPA: XkdF-like putative serine protease domain-containing protein [Candidatus Kapabacteria bacterium]